MSVACKQVNSCLTVFLIPAVLLRQAWDQYYHVFRRINKQLPTLTVLELQYVAPALVRAQVRC